DMSQGNSATFSTGSQAQYPPQPSSEYDQSAPSTSPTVRKHHTTSVHLRMTETHWSEPCPASSAPAPKAKGTVKPMNPRYRNGGGVALRGWVCSRGAGARAAARGVGRLGNRGARALGTVTEEARDPHKPPNAQ